MCEGIALGRRSADDFGGGGHLVGAAQQSRLSLGSFGVRSIWLAIRGGAAFGTVEDSEGVFTVKATGDVLNYEITMSTGCQPGDSIEDCIPDWSIDCPCAQNAIEPQREYHAHD